MNRLDKFKLCDLFGNRIYTAHDIVSMPYTCSYNTVRSLARRFNLGFRKQGILFFTEKDLNFIIKKRHKAGRPNKLHQI